MRPVGLCLIVQQLDSLYIESHLTDLAFRGVDR